MRQIFEHLDSRLRKARPAMLAAVMEEHGSAPRGRGAMMLVGREGRLVGTIGGGAVEKRSVELAQSLLQEERSATHDFFLHQNRREDIGMMCGGDVSVLFQYISPAVPEWQALTAQLLTRRESAGWLLLPLEAGTPVLLDGSGGCLVGSAPEAVQDLMKKTCIRTQSWFSIPLIPQTRAVIFGAGHIGAELAPLLKQVDFQVTVFDDRPEYADKLRFPTADEVICGSYEEIGGKLCLDKEDYAVVITEGHRHDFVVERQLLAHPPAYLGVIGSKTKTAAVNQRLLDCGFSEADLAQVHAPIGTKIKAVTPAEIAVSIAGEMILVRAERRESQKSGGCPMSGSQSRDLLP